MEDVWSEVTDESGTHMVRNTLMLPEGKKPLVISFDDVNYYPYMLDEGFTSKLVVGEDGEIWAQCTDPYTNETFLTSTRRPFSTSLSTSTPTFRSTARKPSSR